MAVIKLTSVEGDQSVVVPPGRALVVGRAVTSDLPVFDPTVSRKHAEVSVAGDGLLVKDLGSSNGTFVNGNRITESPVALGDTVTFGKVAFLAGSEKPPKPKAPPPGDFAQPALNHHADAQLVTVRVEEAGLGHVEFGVTGVLVDKIVAVSDVLQVVSCGARHGSNHLRWICWSHLVAPW